MDNCHEWLTRSETVENCGLVQFSSGTRVSRWQTVVRASSYLVKMSSNGKVSSSVSKDVCLRGTSPGFASMVRHHRPFSSVGPRGQWRRHSIRWFNLLSVCFVVFPETVSFLQVHQCTHSHQHARAHYQESKGARFGKGWRSRLHEWHQGKTYRLMAFNR